MGILMENVKTLKDLTNFSLMSLVIKGAVEQKTLLSFSKTVGGVSVPVRLDGTLMNMNGEAISKRIMKNKIDIFIESCELTDMILNNYDVVNEKHFKDFTELKCHLAEYLI